MRKMLPCSQLQVDDRRSRSMTVNVQDYYIMMVGWMSVSRSLCSAVSRWMHAAACKTTPKRSYVYPARNGLSRPKEGKHQFTHIANLHRILHLNYENRARALPHNLPSVNGTMPCVMRTLRSALNNTSVLQVCKVDIREFVDEFTDVSSRPHHRPRCRRLAPRKSARCCGLR